MEVRMRSKSHNLMEASTGRLSDGWIRVLLLLRKVASEMPRMKMWHANTRSWFAQCETTHEAYQDSSPLHGHAAP